MARLIVIGILEVLNPVPDSSGGGQTGGMGTLSNLIVKDYVRMGGRVLAVESVPAVETTLVSALGGGTAGGGSGGGSASFYLYQTAKLYGVNPSTGAPTVTPPDPLATQFQSARPSSAPPPLTWSVIPNQAVADVTNQGSQGTITGNLSLIATYTPPSVVPLSGVSCIVARDASSTLYATGRDCVYSLALRGTDNTSQQSSYAFVTLTPGDSVAPALAASPTVQFSGNGGGTASVQLAAGSTTSWNAASTANWVRMTSGGSGTGNGTVSYAIDPNTSNGSSPRFANILVNGYPLHEIAQAGTGGNIQPRIVSVSPTSGNTAAVTFGLTVDDPDGQQNLDIARLSINATGPINSPGCVVSYKKQEGRFYLGDNTGNDVPLVSADVQNANCILKLQGTTATPLSGGTGLDLRMAITFPGSFAGAKNIYAYVQDLATANSGWEAWGTWSVPAPPITVTLSANRTQVRPYGLWGPTLTATVTGSSQTSVTWSDNGAGGSFGTPAGNTVYYSPPYTFGANSTITITAKSTADTTKSASLTLTYLRGTPQVVSVSPQSSSGVGPKSFDFTFRDTVDSGDLFTMEMLFWADGANGGAGCHLGYDTNAQTLTLYGSGGGSSSLGSGGHTLDGQYCTVNTVSSYVSVIGSLNYAIHVVVTFKPNALPYYLSPNLMVRGKATDFLGATSGSQYLGTWTAQ